METEKRLREEPSPKKILVVALDNLGDAVMASASLRLIKEIFPESHVGFWVKEYVADLFAGHSLIDSLHAADPFWDKSPGHAKGGLRKFFRVWRDIKKAKYDRVYLLNTEWRRALCCWLAGIPERVGYDRRKSRFFLSHPQTFSETAHHMIDIHLDLIQRDAEKNKSQQYLPFLEVTEKEEGWWRGWSQEKKFQNGKIMALHFFSGDVEKNWPLSSWGKLIQLLFQEYPSFKFLVLVGPDEESRLDGLREVLSKSQVEILSPTLGQLKELLSHACLYIGGDSGPGHVAGALGTSVISLFGSTDPSRYRPQGKGRFKVLQKIPLRSLSVQEVFEEIKKITHV
ncbi:MAG: ADP-heptose--LPS heptosyltransferase 2 [Elusimicrobia bacterium]|nr:ADP-heptose--LPS heptosyltransferase 2 [Elusimicrobiota bacterium]